MFIHRHGGTVIKTGRALLGAFVISAGLFAGGASASAQALTETVFARAAGYPYSMSFGSDRQLYITDFQDEFIRRAPASGGNASEIIQDIGNASIVGPDNSVYVSRTSGEIIRYAPGSITPDSTPYATGFGLYLFALAFDTAGRLYGATSSGDIHRVGVGGGVATEVCDVGMITYGLVVTAAGNPLVIEINGEQIKQCVGNVVSTFATLPGNGINRSLAKDTDGNIYTAYEDGLDAGKIYRVGPTGGTATLFATSSSGVSSIAIRGNDLFVGHPNFDYNGEVNGTVGVFANALAPAPTAVPTLSEWAMILLGVTLAGGAAVVVQRRRMAV